MPRAIFPYTMPPARSRVGNGSALLEGIDGRTTGARRYREVLSSLCNRALRNRLPPIDDAVLLMLRRAAALAIWCEAQDAKIANGEEIDAGEYTAATNTLRRILEDNGLN